jgi:hypothetical protein
MHSTNPKETKDRWAKFDENTFLAIRDAELCWMSKS